MREPFYYFTILPFYKTVEILQQREAEREQPLRQREVRPNRQSSGSFNAYSHIGSVVLVGLRVAALT
jgi:hypothetical protein